MLGRMFGHEFHALVIFQKFLIADDFAALFGFGPLRPLDPHLKIDICTYKPSYGYQTPLVPPPWGTQDVSGQVDCALLAASRRVAAFEHGMDDGADELG